MVDIIAYTFYLVICLLLHLFLYFSNTYKILFTNVLFIRWEDLMVFQTDICSEYFKACLLVLRSNSWLLKFDLKSGDLNASIHLYKGRQIYVNHNLSFEAFLQIEKSNLRNVNTQVNTYMFHFYSY